MREFPPGERRFSLMDNGALQQRSRAFQRICSGVLVRKSLCRNTSEWVASQLPNSSTEYLAGELSRFSAVRRLRGS
jgi:hypothetical protein